jgi:alkylated DNA repair dioxygenase AlkB
MDSKSTDELSNTELQLMYTQWIEVFPSIFSEEYNDNLFETLLQDVHWHKILTHFETGEPKKISRRMAYMADKVVDYKYDKFVFPGQAWEPKLEKLCSKLGKIDGPWSPETLGDYNSVLLNLYEDGKDEIRYHSDKEDQLGFDPEIGCYNLGATRKFHFLDKDTGSKFFYEVKHGDFLKMKSGCQAKFLHSIKQEKEVTQPRISLTFRKVYDIETH